MPIPEKIDIANQKYCDKLKEVQSLVNAESADPDHIGLSKRAPEKLCSSVVLGAHGKGPFAPAVDR